MEEEGLLGSRWLKTLREIPFGAAWVLMLTLGGFIFVSYYICIGYFPDFDLASSFAALAAIAGVSVFFFFLLVVMLVLPALFWNPFVLYEDQSHSVSSSDEAGASDQDKSKWDKVLKRFALPGLCAGYLIVLFRVSSSWAEFFIGVGALAPLFLVPKFIGLLWLWVLKWLGCAPMESWSCGLRDKFWASLLAIGRFLAVAFGLLLAFNFVRAIVPQYRTEGAPEWLVSGSIMLVLIILNFVVLTIKIKAYRRESVGYLVFIIAVVLLGIADPCALPKHALYFFKLGNVDAAKIVLEAKSCSDLGFGDFDVCYLENGDCFIEDVLVLSRLGTEVYLEKHGRGGKPLRFTVRSASVLSYSFEVPDQDGAGEPAARSDSPSQSKGDDMGPSIDPGG